MGENFNYGGGTSRVRVDYVTQVGGGLKPMVEEKISLSFPYGSGEGKTQKSEYYIKAERESDSILLLDFKKNVDIAGRVESSDETLRLRRILDQCFVMRDGTGTEEPHG